MAEAVRTPAVAAVDIMAAALAAGLAAVDTLAVHTADRKVVDSKAGAMKAVAVANRAPTEEAATAHPAAWKPAAIPHPRAIRIIRAPSMMASGIRSATRPAPEVQHSQLVTVARPTAHGIHSAAPEALTSQAVASIPASAMVVETTDSVSAAAGATVEVGVAGVGVGEVGAGVGA